MVLSPKLLAYRQLRLEGKSRYRAAKDSGFSREMCLRASRLDDAVSVALPEILEKEGLDNIAAAELMKAGFAAERAIVVEHKEFNDKGKLVSVTPEIKWIPDMFIRHKFLDTYLDVTGQKKKVGSVDNTDAPANLPQLVINTLNITLENRKVVDVVR